jgi:hypothetical protein
MDEGEGDALNEMLESDQIKSITKQMQSMFGDAVGEGTEIKFKVVKLEVGDALACRCHPPAPLFELSAV